MEATAFSPACVGNVGVGFDILGHTIEGPGDRVTVRRVATRGVRIVDIRVADVVGASPPLPREAPLNTAGAALLALIDAHALPFGFDVALDKGIPYGSGMGGSAASAVAALVAANAVLDAPLSHAALYPYALAGEAVASGDAHGDNVGPMLLGGLVLATAKRLTPIPVPSTLRCVLVHSHAIVETRSARAALAGDYALASFVEQSAHLATLIAGCFSGDLALITEGLNDVLIEPRRRALIRGFAAVKSAALDAGALGASISGAGPSVFAWCADDAIAQAVSSAMRSAFADAGVGSDAWISPVAGPPAGIVACAT
jgi:homoserine kinase